MKTKKTFMLILLSVVLAVFVSCGVQTPPAEPNEDVAAQESQPIAPESDVTVEQPRNTIEISSLYMEPKLEELLNESDIIIEGEVIEEKESYHTNPDADQRQRGNSHSRHGVAVCNSRGSGV